MNSLTYSFDETENLQLSEDTMIGGKLVPKGYINATQLCRLHKFKLRAWIESGSTQGYLKALKETSSIPISELIIKAEGESFEGEYYLWVHPQVEIALCRSIDPGFATWQDRVAYLSIQHCSTQNGKILTADEALAPFPSLSPKQKDPNGIVYLIECEQTNTLKIGFTKNIDSRLKRLQASNPSELKVLYTLSGTIELEQELLTRFKALRIRSEWFKWDQLIVNTFKKRSQPTQKPHL